MKKRTYGWKPDLPDHRDFRLALAVAATLPPSVDMRPACPPVLDQGQLGSCTANAIANAHKFDQMRQEAKRVFSPSRLFIYYNERKLEGTIKQDAGAQIRDGFKTIAAQGVCSETTVPYTIAKFASKPSAKAYAEALKNQALTYQRVTQTVDAMKACLAAGTPFVFGFSVYDSFESAEVAKTGIVPMPAKTESCLGGHAGLCVGYNDTNQRCLVMNSWGTGWGQKGYFEIPYAYLASTDLASDFWTVQTVECAA